MKTTALSSLVGRAAPLACRICKGGAHGHPPGFTPHVVAAKGHPGVPAVGGSGRVGRKYFNAKKEKKKKTPFAIFLACFL